MPQCQFLFSAVFVFQKSCTGNILGIAWDKNPVSYFSVTKTKLEGEQQKTSREATQGPGASKPWPMCGPPWPPPTPPLRPYILCLGKTLDTREKIHEKFRSRRHRRTRLGRVLQLFPAPCRRENPSPEASTSPCLPPRRCVSSPPRDYGSIAVARWLCSPLCASCYLILVSCLTWSRSYYCNAICWFDGIRWILYTMLRLFMKAFAICYLWSCMLSVTSRCFGQVDTFNSKREYLCSIVGSCL